MNERVRVESRVRAFPTRGRKSSSLRRLMADSDRTQAQSSENGPRYRQEVQTHRCAKCVSHFGQGAAKTHGQTVACEQSEPVLLSCASSPPRCFQLLLHFVVIALCTSAAH